VVYAEIRFAPELHTERGLSLEAVVESVLAGFDGAMARSQAAGRPIVVRTLLSAIRSAARSREIAELAVRYRDAGVAGFDVAGPEAGYPPTLHLDAFHLVQRENFHATLHAGEAFGCPRSGRRSSGATPNGSGTGSGSSTTSSCFRAARSRSAVWRATCVTAACPSRCARPRTCTRSAPSLAEHPIGLLRRLSFRVTVNTDNRLMSGVSLSSEMAALVETFDWSWKDLNWLTINAMKSAFYPSTSGWR